MTMVDIEELYLRKLCAEAGGNRDDDDLLILISILLANDCIISNMSLACRTSNLIGQFELS